MEQLSRTLSTLNISEEAQQAVANAFRAAVASASESTANDTARTLATVLKPQKPSPYDGAIDAVASLNFIESQEEYFAIVELIPTKWVRYAVLSLAGDAKAWWRSSGLTIETSWNDFRKAFLEAFTPPDSANAARRELTRLRQKNLTVAEYTSRFKRHLRLIPNMDAGTALYNYMNGLESETSKEVRLRQPTTLDAAIQQATIVHSILHPTNPNNATTTSVPTASSTAEPMDVDAMNVLLANLASLAKTTTVASIRQSSHHTARSSSRPSLPKLDAASREYNMRHGLCHRCRLPGHIAKNCRGDRAFHNIETDSQAADESGKDQGEL